MEFACYYYYFISSLLSPLSPRISLLPFSGRQHKMTHKGRRVIKPQLNQSVKNLSSSSILTHQHRVKCVQSSGQV